jgi:formate/nitrite transporter FocA (FNT family)
MAFVAMGFDHVVANMFFLPAAIFAHVDGITWWNAIHNWIFAFLGNLVGAAVFVAGAYWYMYARDAETPTVGTADGDGDGRFTRQPETVAQR